MWVINIILSGFFLLFFTIIMNAIVQYLKIMTWYDFLMMLKDSSKSTKIRLIDYLWLFVGYPFLLGIIIYYHKNFLLLNFIVVYLVL